jgi:hypothetical protein
VEAVPDEFGTSERAWNAESVGPFAAISKNRSLNVCAIELKSVVGVPEEERMGWMRASRLPWRHLATSQIDVEGSVRRDSK